MIVRNGRSLDGKLTEIIYDDNDLTSYMKIFGRKCPGASVLIEKFIEDAIELDVDAITDGETTLVCGVMEHIEQAGVHSGDSACSIPPYSIDESIVNEIKRQTKLVASEIKAVGIFSMQFAVKSGEVYVLGADARESRTISFVSKATGVNWVQAAAKIIAGKSLKSQGLVSEVTSQFMAVKKLCLCLIDSLGQMLCWVLR